MKIVGTIVEFNPLHNGHCYFIQQVKQQSKADILVAVMSGSFTMRGELSVFDKFTKTKQALQAGIDLVIELPFATVSKVPIYLPNLPFAHYLMPMWMKFGSVRKTTIPRF